MTRQLVVMVAGPYRSGATTEAERAANLQRMNEAAIAVWRLGHVPVVGVTAAMSIATLAAQDERDDVIDGISYALADRCDAVLRLPGASAGADEEVRRIAGRGGRVFNSIAALAEVVH